MLVDQFFIFILHQHFPWLELSICLIETNVFKILQDSDEISWAFVLHIIYWIVV